MNSYSFAISTYSGDDPNHLANAFLSMVSQSLKPRDISLVKDGPLNTVSEGVIKDLYSLCKTYDVILNITELPFNLGRGIARNIAINNTLCEFVALMDADDISHTKRCELQYNEIKLGYDLICSYGLETNFLPAADDVITHPYKGVIKTCPINSESIKSILPYSCPIINPSIFFKKSSWRSVNGYPDYKFSSEDHLLFLKLSKNGCKFKCLPLVLIYIRTSESMLARRVGLRPLKNDINFRFTALGSDLIGFPPFFIGLLISLIRRLIPSNISYNLTQAGRATLSNK